MDGLVRSIRVIRFHYLEDIFMNRMLFSILCVSMMVSSSASCQDLPIELNELSPITALASIVDSVGHYVTETDLQSFVPDVPYALSEDIFNCLPVLTIDSRFFSFFRFTPRLQAY